MKDKRGDNIKEVTFKVISQCWEDANSMKFWKCPVGRGTTTKVIILVPISKYDPCFIQNLLKFKISTQRKHE